jgi:tripeptide aminopeptidase
MKKLAADVDLRWAEDTLWELLHINAPTGHEKPVSDYVRSVLVKLGVPALSIVNDNAHRHILLPTECGNLIVDVPGRGALAKSPRRLFVAHMDTVDLAAGTIPKRKGRYIHSSPGHALGADDRSGVAAVLSMLHTILQASVPHPPITALFTVREESGLWGARMVDAKRLKNPAYGFSFDGSESWELDIQAPGSDRMDITVHGIASHAGGDPEKGVSAAVVASVAIAELHKKHLHGLIKEGPSRATSNIGSMNGGVFHNIVCPEMKVIAEARSYIPKRLAAVVAAYKRAFLNAVRKVKNDKGKRGSLDFKVERLYHPFKLSPAAPVVRFTLEAMKAAGVKGRPQPCKGGLDANWLVRHGIPTVTLGAGIIGAHTVTERLDIEEFRKGCLIATSLATVAG